MSARKTKRPVQNNKQDQQNLKEPQKIMLMIHAETLPQGGAVAAIPSIPLSNDIFEAVMVRFEARFEAQGAKIERLEGDISAMADLLQEACANNGHRPATVPGADPVATAVSEAVTAEESADPKSPVTVEQTEGPDGLIQCLECGAHMKTLKRHLLSARGLSPEEYPDQWGLDETCSLTSRACSERKRQVALKRGFGKKKAQAR